MRHKKLKIFIKFDPYLPKLDRDWTEVGPRLLRDRPDENLAEGDKIF